MPRGKHFALAPLKRFLPRTEKRTVRNKSQNSSRVFFLCVCVCAYEEEKLHRRSFHHGSTFISVFIQLPYLHTEGFIEAATEKKQR